MSLIEKAANMLPQGARPEAMLPEEQRIDPYVKDRMNRSEDRLTTLLGEVFEQVLDTAVQLVYHGPTELFLNSVATLEQRIPDHRLSAEHVLHQDRVPGGRALTEHECQTVT